jgi:hypothetical protein
MPGDAKELNVIGGVFKGFAGAASELAKVQGRSARGACVSIGAHLFFRVKKTRSRNEALIIS